MSYQCLELPKIKPVITHQPGDAVSAQQKQMTRHVFSCEAANNILSLYFLLPLAAFAPIYTSARRLTVRCGIIPY